MVNQIFIDTPTLSQFSTSPSQQLYIKIKLHKMISKLGGFKLSKNGASKIGASPPKSRSRTSSTPKTTPSTPIITTDKSVTIGEKSSYIYITGNPTTKDDLDVKEAIVQKLQMYIFWRKTSEASFKYMGQADSIYRVKQGCLTWAKCVSTLGVEEGSSVKYWRS